jgi:hypothetical protein
MLYVDPSSRTIVASSDHELRQVFRNVSLPANPTTEDLLAIGVMVAYETQPAHYNHVRQTIVRDVPEEIDGVWTVALLATDYPDAHERMMQFRADVVTRIKAEAGRRILMRLPDWKQRNYLARSLELTRKEQAGTKLTWQEAREIMFIEGEWAWAKSTRLASDVAEQEAARMSDDEVIAFSIYEWPGWPL